MNAFQGNLDVVAIQEAYRSSRQHNGEALAGICGVLGYWANHNNKPQGEPHSPTGRANEYIGMMGKLIIPDDVQEIDIGGNRKALIVVIGDVAFVAAHLRATTRPELLVSANVEREAGARAIVKATEPYDAAVIALDRNAVNIPWFNAAHKVFKGAGYQSAYELDGKRPPKTFPTKDYRAIHGLHHEFAFDDILVRGERINVLATGVITRVILPVSAGQKYVSAPLDPSDHEFPYATLEVTPRHD